MSWEALYDDAGQHIGYAAEADDGAIVAADTEGNIFGAVAPDGTALDPNAYEVDNGQDDGTGDYVTRDELAAYHAEMARLQQLGPVDDIDPEQTWHRMQADVAQQADSFEARIGRQLTQREQLRLAEVLSHHAAAGRDVDIAHAAQQLEEEGFRFHSKDTHDDRVKLAVERLADRDREQRGATIDETPAPREGGYDKSSHEDRVARAMDRAAGVDVDAHTYDSRDAAEN